MASYGGVAASRVGLEPLGLDGLVPFEQGLADAVLAVDAGAVLIEQDGEVEIRLQHCLDVGDEATQGVMGRVAVGDVKLVEAQVLDRQVLGAADRLVDLVFAVADRDGLRIAKFPWFGYRVVTRLSSLSRLASRRRMAAD